MVLYCIFISLSSCHLKIIKQYKLIVTHYYKQFVIFVTEPDIWGGGLGNKYPAALLMTALIVNFVDLFVCFVIINILV